jgi:hypothetical protein
MLFSMILPWEHEGALDPAAGLTCGELTQEHTSHDSFVTRKSISAQYYRKIHFLESSFSLKFYPQKKGSYIRPET